MSNFFLIVDWITLTKNRVKSSWNPASTRRVLFPFSFPVKVLQVVFIDENIMRYAVRGASYSKLDKMIFRINPRQQCPVGDCLVYIVIGTGKFNTPTLKIRIKVTPEQPIRSQSSHEKHHLEIVRAVILAQGKELTEIFEFAARRCRSNASMIALIDSLNRLAISSLQHPKLVTVSGVDLGSRSTTLRASTPRV